MLHGTSALTTNLIPSVGLAFCSRMSVVRGLSRMVLMQATGSADITEVKEQTDDLSAENRMMQYTTSMEDGYNRQYWRKESTL